jgi:hypothetical protein
MDSARGYTYGRIEGGRLKHCGLEPIGYDCVHETVYSCLVALDSSRLECGSSAAASLLGAPSPRPLMPAPITPPSSASPVAGSPVPLPTRR